MPFAYPSEGAFASAGVLNCASMRVALFKRDLQAGSGVDLQPVGSFSDIPANVWFRSVNSNPSMPRLKAPLVAGLKSVRVNCSYPDYSDLLWVSWASCTRF